MKKGILSAIIVNGALALSALVYTIVALVVGLGGKKKESVVPSTTNIALAVRVDDLFSFEEGKIVFSEVENENPEFEANEDQTAYVAKNAGSFSAVVTKASGNKFVYAVTVYGYGAGTQADPFNICNASHLFNLKKVAQGQEAETIYNNLSKVFALRSDIDLSAYNWNPIGRLDGPLSAQLSGNEGEYTVRPTYLSEEVYANYQFTGSFNGNGYKIKNLTINVDQSNFADFISVYYKVVDGNAVPDQVELELGFFGYAYQANISNLNFENSSITLASSILNDSFTVVVEGSETAYSLRNTIDKVEGRINFSQKIGILAGTIDSCFVEKVSITNSEVTGFSCHPTNGVGLMAGLAKFSAVSKVNIIDSSVTANGDDTYVGGLIGVVCHSKVTPTIGSILYYLYNDLDESKGQILTTVTDCTLTNVTVIGKNGEDARAAGISASVENGNFTNIKVENINVGLYGENNDTYAARIAGGFTYVRSANSRTGIEYNSVLKNISINGTVDAIYTNQLGHSGLAAGLVYENSGSTIEDCSFKGKVKASIAAGLVGLNFGKINYTNTFTGKAVDAEIYALSSGAGVIYKNFGEATGNSEVKTPVSVVIEWKKVTSPTSFIAFAMTGIVGATVDDASDAYVIAGFAGYSTGEASTISNFSIDATIINPVNGAGIVGFAGIQKVESVAFTQSEQEYSGQTVTAYNTKDSTFSGGEISNIDANVNIQTITSTNGPMGTKRSSGGFAIVYSGTTIENIEVTGNINGYANANTTTILSSTYAGGLVAQILATSETQIISISDCVSKVAIRVNTSGFEINGARASLVGGLIAFVKQTGAANVSIEDCLVESENENSFLENNLGLPTINYASSLTYNEDITGVGGLFGVIESASSTYPVLVSNCDVKGMNLSAYYISVGFAISTTNATISDCATDIQTISGRKVSGFIGGTLGTTTIARCGSKVETLALQESENQRFAAGFVAFGRGTLSVTDAYAYIKNVIEQATDSVDWITGFAIVSDAETTASFTRCVVYSTITKGETRVAPFLLGNGATTPTRTNCYVLSPTTDTSGNVKFIEAESMTNLSNFSGFSAEIWEVLEGGLFPTLK